MTHYNDRERENNKIVNSMRREWMNGHNIYIYSFNSDSLIMHKFINMINFYKFINNKYKYLPLIIHNTNTNAIYKSNI